MAVTVLIGTSGWQYRDWRGRFYPQKLPQRLWLEHYAQHLATVESNNAFYRLPERATFEKWRERTPPDFRWAVKASRYLTHIRRLREPGESGGRMRSRGGAGPGGAGGGADEQGRGDGGPARPDPPAAAADAEGRRRPAPRLPGTVP